MALYEGSAMRLKIGAKTILHETNVEIEVQTEMKDISTKDIAGIFTSPGKQSFSISGSAYADNSTGAAQEDIKTILASWKAGSLITLTIADGVTGNVTLSGDGYFQNVKISADDGEVVKYDFSLKGNGDVDVGETA